jgi:hypothetical protein
MTYSGPTAAGLGALGLATQYVPGGAGDPATFVVPTEFLLAKTLGLKSTAKVNKHKTFGNSRDSNRVMRNGKFKNGGQFTYPFFPTFGLLLPVAGLGTSSLMSAVASDTAASITTATGVSTVVLTGGSGTYIPGAWVDTDTGANQETRQIITWTSGTKTLTMAALDLTHGATPAVVQPQQLKVYPFSRTTGFENDLRRISAEENVGGAWAWRYSNCMVGKWEIAGGKDSVVATVDLAASTQRLRATPTSFSATLQQDQDAIHAFQNTDGFLVTGADPTATGTSTVQRTLWVEDWKFSLDNHLIEAETWNNDVSYQYFPGDDREVMLDYKIINTAQRAAAWEDLVAQNKEAPLFISMAQNVGTPSSKSWNAVGVYVPNAHYEDSEDIVQQGSVIGEHIKAAGRSTGGDVAQLWIRNSAIVAAI